MKLIFIYGLPGVGKLTVANELANVTGYKIFHNHLAIEMISSVFRFGSEPFIKLRERIWLMIFKYAQKYESPGLIFTFVFEKTVASNFIEKVKKTMNRNGEVCFVKLVCQQDEHNKRIVDDSRAKFEGKIRSI
ncbi:MAG: AAA family ATPase, partial [Firmicutes bacterium]|nr:AAA family ATPase [Bacillota bacterium]